MVKPRRMYLTNEIEKIEDPIERLMKMNEALQAMHFSSNEVRRILPLAINAVTEALSKNKKPSPKKGDKETA